MKRMNRDGKQAAYRQVCSHLRVYGNSLTVVFNHIRNDTTNRDAQWFLTDILEQRGNEGKMLNLRKMSAMPQMAAVLAMSLIMNVQVWAGPSGPVNGPGHSTKTAGSQEGMVTVELPVTVLTVVKGGAWMGGVPIYAEPDFNSTVANVLYLEEMVRLIEHMPGGWSKILYNGQERFVYSGDGAFLENNTWPIPEGDADRAALVAYGFQYLGAPYRYGGNDAATGSDCSGFIRQVMSNGAGVSLPRTSQQQAGSGSAVDISQIRCGDILAYGSGGSINHVGIYIGDGMMLHSENSENGVVITNMENQENLAGVRRVLP